MTSTFDGSTSSDAAYEVPRGSSVRHDDPPLLPVSALDQLRSSVESQTAPQPWVKVLPKIGVRLTCSTDIDNKSEYQRWMRAALPKTKGARQGAPDMTQLDRYRLASLSILAKCESIEVRNRAVTDPEADDAWIVVTDPTSHEPLTLTDKAALDAFKTPDPVALLVKIFGRQADVIAAGEEFLTAAGFIPGDEPEDESDPT
jgi:hypothetical protein